MTTKTFADTSAVSLAYAIDPAAKATDLTATEFFYIPYTSEGFSVSKETQRSTAITDDRRVTGSKNTRGTAAGSAGLEFGYTPFVLDMLALSLMSEWGTDMAGDSWIIDGDAPQFFVVEKCTRAVKAGVKNNYLERFYGNLVNEASMGLGTSELINFSVNTMAVFADLANADATSDDKAGGLATTYTVPSPYEIADSSNNISKIELKDEDGAVMEVVWSEATLTITNNVREQPAIGSQFSAGMGMGKVNVSLSGTIYFYDDTVLKSHLDNKWMSAVITVDTEEGSFTFSLPRLKAEAPTANSQGENQDYTQSLTLVGEKGKVNIGDEERDCVIAISHSAAV